MSAYRRRLCCALALGACLSVFHGTASASQGPHDVVRLCIATEPHPPYTNPKLETTIQQRIRQAAAS